MRKLYFRALLTFMTFADSALSTFASKVIAALTGNTNFSNMSPLLAELVTATNEYIALLNQAQGGSRLQISTKNDAKEVLLDVLRRVAFEVNYVANGDRSIALSSGFEITADFKKAVAPVNAGAKAVAA